MARLRHCVPYMFDINLDIWLCNYLHRLAGTRAITHRNEYQFIWNCVHEDCMNLTLEMEYLEVLEWILVCHRIEWQIKQRYNGNSLIRYAVIGFRCFSWMALFIHFAWYLIIVFQLHRTKPVPISPQLYFIQLRIWREFYSKIFIRVN